MNWIRTNGSAAARLQDPRTQGESDVTRLLGELTAGRREALHELLPIVYSELRSIAHRQLGGERPGHTLNTTALVHEAYLKLVRLERIQWRDRAHFFGVAAGAMRRILVEYAEMRRALKRGGGAADLHIDDLHIAAAGRDEQVLALEEALQRLERVSERHARIIECRFFAGLSIEETAEALGVSSATIKRDWALARAWLNRELGR
jgi:RNA polymerase sigma factor (TIGR02999 family)